jgi:anti-anti-sigma factor
MALQLLHPQAPYSAPPVQSTPLHCALQDRGSDVAWVHTAGELVAATAPQLTRTLRRAERQARMVVLDLRQLTISDHSGVQVIASAGLRARRTGRRLILIRAPGQVDRVLATTHGADRLQVVDLDPGVPMVQALLVLAQEDQAA